MLIVVADEVARQFDGRLTALHVEGSELGQVVSAVLYGPLTFILHHLLLVNLRQSAAYSLGFHNVVIAVVVNLHLMDVGVHDLQHGLFSFNAGLHLLRVDLSKFSRRGTLLALHNRLEVILRFATIGSGSIHLYICI